jgi:hypothetical protein
MLERVLGPLARDGAAMAAKDCRHAILGHQHREGNEE